MELSVLLAKIYGVVMIFMGLGMLINMKYYRKLFDEIMVNKTAIFFNGVLAAAAGIAMITYHNIWEASWVVIITIFAWAATLKGFGLLVFPNHVKIWQKMFKNSSFFLFESVALVVLGAVLIYFGFFV